MSEGDKQTVLGDIDAEDESGFSHLHIRQLGIEVPENWEEVSLDDIGQLDTSSVNKKSDSHEEAVNLVNYMDVYNNYMIDSRVDFMEVTAPVSQVERSQVRVGDILFTPSSEEPRDIGNSAVVTEDMERTLHSYHTVRLRPNSEQVELDISFSGWLANAPYVKKQFARRSTGSTRYTLTLGDFSNTQVLVPPLEEQRKIATVLYTVDRAIEVTQNVVDTYEAIREGVLRELINVGVTQDGKFRPEPDENPDSYSETRWGEIPKKWDIGVVSELVLDERPVTYGIVKAGDHVQGGIPMIRGENYLNGWEPLSNFFRVSPEINNEYSRSTVRPGDILLAVAGANAGSVNIVPEWMPDEVNISRSTARISVDESKVIPEYMRFALESPFLQKQIHAWIACCNREICSETSHSASILAD